MTIIDEVRHMARTTRREIDAAVEELYPEPAPDTGADFGRKLGLWLAVGTIVIGVAAAVITVFTDD